MFITRSRPMVTRPKSCRTNNRIYLITKRAFSTGASVLIGFTSFPTLVQAQNDKFLIPTVNSTARHPSSNSTLARFVPPPLPPGQEAPGGRRHGGASRCLECTSDDLRLTALVPGKDSKSSMALTAAEHPTFWFYIPYALTASHSVEFVLQDAADRYHYKTTFAVPGTPPGVVSLSLPPDVAPLEIGRQYHWTFLINDRSNSVFVQGTIQRVTLSPTLIKQLETATRSERTALYAANGIWHETLSTLGELRRTKPDDAALAAAWADLLHSVGLDNIGVKPIVQCCTAETTTAIK